MDLALDGQNIFLTGLPGSGKSYVLKQLVQLLQHRDGLPSVGVTASTGVAGIHVQGSTIHSFLGCGRAESQKDGRREVYRVWLASQLTWRHSKKGRLTNLYTPGAIFVYAQVWAFANDIALEETCSLDSPRAQPGLGGGSREPESA